MYNTLPRSFKTEVLVSAKEEDPELVRERQELIKAKTPKELSVIHGLDEFPLPERIETMVRPNKRALKSSSSKDQLPKRRYFTTLLTALYVLCTNNNIIAKAGLNWLI